MPDSRLKRTIAVERIRHWRRARLLSAANFLLALATNCSNKKTPRSVYARAFPGHIPNRSGDLLPLPAPPEQNPTRLSPWRRSPGIGRSTPTSFRQQVCEGPFSPLWLRRRRFQKRLASALPAQPYRTVNLPPPRPLMDFLVASPQLKSQRVQILHALHAQTRLHLDLPAWQLLPSQLC